MFDIILTVSTIIGTLGTLSLFTPDYISFTFAILLGLAWFLILDKKLPHFIKWIMIGLQTILAVIVSGYAESVLGYDSSSIIIDEFIAISFLFLFFIPWHHSRPVLTSIVALILFSLIDNLKPLGIESIQKLSGGLGIVGDDILAATFASILLVAIYHILKYLNKK